MIRFLYILRNKSKRSNFITFILLVVWVMPLGICFFKFICESLQVNVWTLLWFSYAQFHYFLQIKCLKKYSTPPLMTWRKQGRFCKGSLLATSTNIWAKGRIRNPLRFVCTLIVSVCIFPGFHMDHSKSLRSSAPSVHKSKCPFILKPHLFPVGRSVPYMAALLP